ncbi:MAG: glycosyltransferase, partial [Geobacteraceae bacterium]|nr:glycosyltransferase [Geobacteraceae bacterium]
PVWNNPTETRECLAALVEHSFDFRLILLDIGSDQPTEQLLHEFAEFLDDRALLLRSESASGFVTTVNRGLAKAEAPLAVVMRSTSRVTAGWLEPFQEASLRPDAGIIVPRLYSGGPAPAPKKRRERLAAEALHGSFSALGITRDLYAAIGDFDEGLDGDVWCLKDYSRRADRSGFRTLRLAGPPILYREKIPYGSLDRREKIVLESIATYTSRWGEGQNFCSFLAPGTDQETLGKAFSSMLTAARRGHSFFVFAPPSVFRKILSASLHLLHDNILVEKLPRVFPRRACRAAFARLRAGHPDICVVTGMPGLLDLEGEKGLTFAEFEKSISTAEV